MKSRPWWTTPTAFQLAVIAGLLAVLYLPVLRWLYHRWSTDGDWSHGFIIPLFSIYYLMTREEHMPRAVRDPSRYSRPVGAAILLLAFVLYGMSTMGALQIKFFQSISLILSIMGAVIMVCGWPMARWGWFAVAFLLFAVPLPVQAYQDLTMPLREIASTVSGVVLSLIPDMVAESHGTVVVYDYKGATGTLDIERACSGMRLLMTMTALGVAMAFFHERPMWQRLVMILACVPIAVFCNIIRVTTTGFFVVFGREDLARGMWHTLLGLGMLAIAFGLYGAISYVLNHLVVESDVDERKELVTGGLTG